MTTASKWRHLCYWLVLLHSVLGLRSAANALSQSPMDIKDKIIELQCYAKCGTSARSQHCQDQCRNELVTQPRRGQCPLTDAPAAAHENDIAPMQRLACLFSCQYDSDCPDVQKCCESSSCGAPVCTEALGLRVDNQLPPIPQIVKFKLPRGHKVEITLLSAANGTYYSHVESRSHFGVIFSARKLGAWQCQAVEMLAEISDSRSKRIDVGFNLKPSRWYQVRVAAINAYGFRGYSEPSAPFTLLNHPKPPKAPVNMTLYGTIARHINGTLHSVRLNWCPARSNLPIEKYKIIWSLYVQKSEDQSFISHQAYVKDTHQFLITDLLPDSSYYIQVQAIAISGNRRLKSDKLSRLYNVTADTIVPYEPLQCSSAQAHSWRQHYDDDDGDHDNDNNDIASAISTSSTTTPTTANASSGADGGPYTVRYRMNRKIGMIVQISGFNPHRERVYELCPKETNCEQREYSAIRAKKNALEFRLKFETTYMLKASGAGISSATTLPFTFTTPKCDNFRKRFPKMQIKC